MSSLSISLLGAPGIRLDNRPITFGTRKAAALLAYLAVSAAAHSRDALMAIFWPEAGNTKARASLRQTLWALHQTGLEDWVATAEENVWLRPGYSLDTNLFQTLTAEARAHTHPPETACPQCSSQLFQAAQLYRGDFLAGFSLKDSPEFEEWQRFQAENMRQLLASALEKLILLQRAEGNFEQATACARRWVALDPLNEPAQRELIRLYALTGKRGLAIKQYETLRQTLKRELGVKPDAESQEMFQDLSKSRVSLNERSPASTRAENYERHNLPALLTRFIGRETQIRELTGLLRRHRLVTLTGSGGTGKTRLALRVAEELVNDFPGGAWLVEFAPETGPELVAQAVATALGLQKATENSYMTLLVNYLHGQRLLLIMDNCEHLLEACARLADELVRRCPQLTVLATSREPLRTEGEIAYRVPSLAAPTPGARHSLEELAQFEAVILFADRAASVLPGFRLAADILPAAARICQRLDGIPLAIELAAARVNVLSVEQIAARLDDRFHLLTSGSRTALPRQRTLRASIDWSYQLLPHKEKLLIERLSVFLGGWNLPAAEAVCAGEGQEGWEILDGLAGLVSKSLVVVDFPEGGDSLSRTEQRYRMLETIRAYARERLDESRKGAETRDRHLAYFLGMAEEFELMLHSSRIYEVLERLDLEVDNLRAAIGWAVEYEDRSRAEQAAGIIKSLFYFWWVRSLVGEVDGWMQRIFNILPADEALTAWSLLLLAFLKFEYTRLFEETVAHLNTCISLLRRANTGDQAGQRLELALALAFRGVFFCFYHQLIQFVPSIDLKDALRDGEESLALVASLDQEDSLEADWLYAWIYSAVSFIYHANGNIEQRDLLYQKGYEKATLTGDQVCELYLITNRIITTQSNRAGLPSPSDQRNLERGMDLSKRLGWKLGLGRFLCTAGLISFLNRDFAKMEQAFNQGEQIYRQAGDLWGVIWATRMVGIAAYHQAKTEKSRSFLTEALDLAIANQDENGILAGMIALAGLALLENQSSLAARLLGFVERQYEGFFKPIEHYDQIEFDQHTSRLRETLSETEFAVYWQAGRALTRDQALSLARGLLDGETQSRQ